MSFIWNDQLSVKKNMLKSIVKQKLVDQFIQDWFSQLGNSSRGKFYGSFKTEFKLESYLIKLNTADRIYMAKFRCSNVKLPVETGRWASIPIHQRICKFCKTLGNEYHYLFVCNHPEIVEARNKFIPQYYTRNPNVSKLNGLLTYCNVRVYRNLSYFIKNIIKILASM